LTAQRVIRNAAGLILGQPVSWLLTLAFTVLVPRNVGPDEWGQWMIGTSIAQVALIVFDVGSMMVLLKGVSRYPEDSKDTLGAALTMRLLLGPLMVLSIAAFTVVARYGEHTQVVVVLIGVSMTVAYLAVPIMTALQAREEMILVAAANLLVVFILAAGAFVLVKLLALGIVAIALLSICAQLIALGLQFAWLSRRMPARPVLNLDLMRQLLYEGLPYWATRGVVTMYVWIDAVLISLFGTTYENGWYGVAGQLMTIPGFIVTAITTATFPMLSRGLPVADQEAAQVVGRSFRLLVTLSLPMAAGLALISGNLVTRLYGPWFAPAGPILVVLSLTIPPVFIATLAGNCLVAVDRQMHWTWVMVGLFVANLGLNLFAIPFFHARMGDGALGAAFVLLVTDTASGVAGLILLPRRLRPGLVAAMPRILAAVGATAVMMAAVWPLRHAFLPIPVAAGAVTFGAAALLLRVFPRDELDMMRRLARKAVGGRQPAPAGAEPAVGPARPPEPDSEVA
jgi:PST family polysaccharide transporter